MVAVVVWMVWRTMMRHPLQQRQRVQMDESNPAVVAAELPVS